MSFVVRHGGRYLHHNFVVALLNDLFGIQARGGCSCAGPTATGCWASMSGLPEMNVQNFNIRLQLSLAF